jgi:hypothetical protein
MVANPLIGTFGTLDTDPSARKAVVAMTRDGVMFAYRTPAPACSPSSWPRFHHDPANSGDYSRDAIDPGALTGVAFKAGKLTFTAPGDDLLCGRVARYDAVQADFKPTGASFDLGDPVPTNGIAIDSPGKPQTLQLGGRLRRYLAIRAVDDQGNVGPVAVVATGSPPATDPCGDRTPPRTAIAAKGVKVTSTSVTVTGTSRDAGCKSLAQAKLRDRILVSVSVSRRYGSQCRFLQLDRKLGRKRTCSIPTKLRTVGRYSLKTHTLTWTLLNKAKLPPGTYVVTALGVDQSGNAERKVGKQNRRTVTVKKPKRTKPKPESAPRSSARR